MARRLLAAAAWGVLAAALLLPGPVQAAEGRKPVYLAHLASPQAHRHADEAATSAPGRTDPVRPPGAGKADVAAGNEPDARSRSAAAVSPFLPHGVCLSWRPALLWTHIIADALTALAYFSIPVALLVFVRRRRDLQFNWMFVLFGIFIMACGTGHLMSLYNLWVPDYLSSGAVKAFTALVSVVTAVLLWALIPKALALPGPAQWEAVHSSLRNEIAERQEAEKEVRRLNAELERRVLERTAELETANRRLAEANRGLQVREAELRESQCLLRAVIDHSTAVIYVKDLQGRYLLINRRFGELFHVTQEAVAGRTDHDLFPREQADAFRAFDRRVLAATAPLEAEEAATQDDGPHTYLSIKAPLLDPGGQAFAVCGISADITGRKRAEEENRRLNAELEQKVAQLVAAQEELVRKEKLAILGQLSGSVGHELRNPLGVMGNAVYFLKMVLTDADETVKEYLGIIEHEIATSQRIIADLLDFARTKPPQKAPVAVLELASRSLGKCAIPPNVSTTVDIPPALPPLMVDPLQLGQVLVNFITNAVQAMPEGGALRIGGHLAHGEGEKSAELSAKSHELDGDFVEISVTDSGEGISPENLPKLFHPLFTTKPRGIGLGLVVCRNLVEANGGKIEVESVVGKGTTFRVVLPAARS